MARGWESKSVEAQQTGNVPAPRKSSLSPEEREQQRKRESLELSRSRVERELATARTDVHRAALENALAYLDDELSRLESSDQT